MEETKRRVEEVTQGLHAKVEERLKEQQMRVNRLEERMTKVAVSFERQQR